MLWEWREGSLWRSMEAEEWGRRALAADRGGLMQRPRLLDLLSRRWYSIGDCKALRKLRCDSKICTTSLTQALQISGEDANIWKRTTLPSGLRDVSTKRASSPSTLVSTPRQLTLMLFLKMYPGMEKPFFRSIGSLKITICSNRKTRLSLARDKKLLSCSVTVKVSCWSSLPWAVIFPSKPCSLPTFIMSLQRFGTKHITSTALSNSSVSMPALV